MSAGSSWALLPLLVSVFSASIVGSPHCAGMCGPFVTVYAVAGGADRHGASRGVLHVAYHVGRAVTYASVGALAGFLGSLVDLAGRAAGLGRVAAIGSSLLLVAWGLGVLFPRWAIKTPWDGALGRRLVQLRRGTPIVRASLLGTLTPLLPCGWFYAFVVTAAGTGGVLQGALVMAVFWLGTVPALLGVGLVMTRWGTAMRRRVPLLTGALLIALGLWGVATRMTHPLHFPSISGASDVSQTRAPCH